MRHFAQQELVLESSGLRQVQTLVSSRDFAYFQVNQEKVGAWVLGRIE
jgi:hypothetical protein